MIEPLVIRQSHHNNEIVVSGDGIVARFSGENLAPRGAHLALWFALPIAMRVGRTLRIDGAICPTALANAQKLVTIWSNISPDLFSPIEISASVLPDPEYPIGDTRLMTFSGGIDSTTALRNLHRNTGERPDLLTI